MDTHTRVLWLKSKNSGFGSAADALFRVDHAVLNVDATGVSTDLFDPRHEPRFICCAFEYLLLGELTLITELRRRYAHIPLILITRSPSADLAIWALRAGVHDLLCEPITADMVRNAATSALKAYAAHDSGASQGEGLRLASTMIAFPPHTRAARVRQLQVVREAFEKNLDKPLNQTDGASLCHYSSSHFSRRFSEEFGETFARYKMKFRIDRACELLALPNYPISEVAALVGFTDPSYFSRVFRDVTGQTPSDYRDSLAQKARPPPAADSEDGSGQSSSHG